MPHRRCRLGDAGRLSLGREGGFAKEIENEAFVGLPTITIERIVEENDVVVAEGAVQARRRDGGVLNAKFCDVFVMENARVKRLVSYVVEVKD